MPRSVLIGVAALLHQVEDGVATLDDARRLRARRASPSSCLLGIADQVVVAGRLRDGGQDGGLREGQLAEVGDPEVVLGRGPDAVAVVAVEVLVVVGGDDPSLAVQAGVGLGDADRLDDLLDLALDSALGVLDQGGIEEPLAHELLGEGRRPAPVTLERVEGRRAERHRVEARVGPEGLVLDRGQWRRAGPARSRRR